MLKAYACKVKTKLLTKKSFYSILLLSSVFSVMFLTLQSPEETVHLSEAVRRCLECVGIYCDFHSVRSNVHYFVYFILGFFLCLFGKEHKMKWWALLLFGGVFALLDEGIKIFLPTREFDAIDLMKDWIGVSLAVVIVIGWNRMHKKY